MDAVANGAIDNTLGAATLTSTGTSGPIVGSVAAVLDLSLVGSGAAPISGALGSSLASLEMAAEGDVAPVEGAVAATLEDLAMVGGSVEFQYGGATITLGELGMAGTGVPASATGAVVKYLEDVVMGTDPIFGVRWGPDSIHCGKILEENCIVRRRLRCRLCRSWLVWPPRS